MKVLSRWFRQRVAEGGIGIQGRDVNLVQYMGLDYKQVRDIARDIANEVFAQNFQKMSGLAGDVARARVGKFNDGLIDRLVEEHPDGLRSA